VVSTLKCNTGLKVHEFPRKDLKGPRSTGPTSNPDESLNHDFKTSLHLEPASQNDDLMHKAMRIMKRIAQIPERVQSYLQHPVAAYAA
jgi:hypothetical protein